MSDKHFAVGDQIQNLLSQVPTSDIFKPKPSDFLPSTDFKFPEIEPIPLIEKIEEIIKQNEILNKTNAEIKETLNAANTRIESLERRAAQSEESHKHDFLKSAVIAVVGAFVGAIAGFVLSVWAKGRGWL